MKFAEALSLVWIVATATAMPSQHTKSHHKHSKSRDLSNAPYPPEDIPGEEGASYENSRSNESPASRKRESFGSMKSWEPTHEDYGSDEYSDLAEEEIQDDLQRPTEKHMPTPYDACKNVLCHYGRECRVTPGGQALCQCAHASFCAGHHKWVCGSDGVSYPSHCELHRQACLKNHHIQIDHSMQACTKIQDTMSDANREIPAFSYEGIDNEQIEEKRDGRDVKQESQKLTENETKLLLSTSVTRVDSEEDEFGAIPTPEDVAEADRMHDLPEQGCTREEYERLKQNLLQYHCSRVGEDECFTSAASKQFVVNIMFTYYDRSGDALLDVDELRDVEERDHLAQLSIYCSLTDIMNRDDTDGDHNITLHEFYQAFDVTLVHLEEHLRVFTTAVTTGNSVELKCDIKGAAEIIWKRNGGMLDNLPNDEITVFQDGSLYIGHIGLHHLGNYSCQDRYNNDVIQTHLLSVQIPPVVKVSPSTQIHSSGTSLEIRCRADGVPQPQLSWQRNERPLPNQPRHYTLLYNGGTLEINSASYTQDTGAYKCKARNAAGRAQDIATVFIESSPVPQYNDHDLHEQFIVFHDAGYTVYDPKYCYMEHQVSGLFSKFAQQSPNPTLLTLCEEGQACSWGSVVNVKNKFVFVSQPKLNRVVMLALDGSNNPLKVIETDATPVKLTYVEHLDQVWILCWNGPKNTGENTIMYIRGASEPDEPHSARHIEAASVKVVDDLFLPRHNDLENKLTFGYVTHHQQQALYKLDLKKLKYVSMVDLQAYGCTPQSVAFVPLGGQVMVYCKGHSEKSARLVLDYITDDVLEYVDLAGEPHVSPDGRKVVAIDRVSNTLSVYNVNDAGKLEHLFDEYTSFHMSDFSFYPSERERGYDMFATSANRNDILYVNLASGKIEIIEGVGDPINLKDWPWSDHNRAIVSGGAFAEYLMSPSKDSVIVIDGRRRHVQCEWQEIINGNVIVWLQPQKMRQ